MSKELNFTTDQGINLPFSYWKVVSIYLDVNRKTLDFSVFCYKNEQAMIDNLVPITSRNYSIPNKSGFSEILDNITSKTKNPLEIAYENLNKDEFFKDSIDV